MAKRSTFSRSRIGSWYGCSTRPTGVRFRRSSHKHVRRDRKPTVFAFNPAVPESLPGSKTAPHSAIDRGVAACRSARLPHLGLISELRIGRRCCAAWRTMRGKRMSGRELLALAGRRGADHGSEPRAWPRDRPRLRREGSIRNAGRPVRSRRWSGPATCSSVVLLAYALARDIGPDGASLLRQFARCIIILRGLAASRVSPYAAMARLTPCPWQLMTTPDWRSRTTCCCSLQGSPIDPTRRHYDELAAIASRRDQEAVDRMIDILVDFRASGGRRFRPRARSWSTKPRRRYSIPAARARMANPEHQGRSNLADCAPRAVTSFSIEKLPRGSLVRYLDCLCNATLYPSPITPHDCQPTAISSHTAEKK
jgi:hypothetical protein